uniref:Nephrin n=1 Tax=Trichuris muris TaxID=70415 RepID=A0A5S6QMZ9_TRIMR
MALRHRSRIGILLLLLAILAGDSSAERQYFQAPPSNASVVEGDTVVLQCVVGNQYQQGRTHWTKDGIVLGFDYNLSGYERYRVVGTHALGEYNLEIVNAQLEDNGEFECQVLPTPGEEEGLRARAFLNVLVPPKSITLGADRDAAKLETRAGRHFQTECRVGGSRPKADIRWYKNGLLIEDPTKYEETSQGDKLTTTISRLGWTAEKEDDGALFTCQAFHPAMPATKTLKTNFTLAVLYAPSVPEIRGYDGRPLKFGERLRLECHVANGNPLPEVIWYRNEKIIDRTYVTHATASVNEYEFVVDGSDNDVSYTCHASNAAVVAPLSSSVRLNVFYPPDAVELMVPDSARVGQVVSLSCTSGASNPPAKILWVIDGKPIKENVNTVRPSSKVKGFHTNSNVSVQMTNERRDVSVVCSAVNEELPSSDGGRTSVTKKISILYAPETVTMFGYDGSPLIAGSVARLSCVATGGNPLPTITWYKGKRRLNSNIRSSVSDNVAQSELTFTAAPSDNKAIYKCTAANTVSEKELVATANLTVHFPPDSVSVNVKPNVLRAGDIAQLICESGSGNPAPVITWWKGGDSLAGMDVHNKSSANGGWTVKSKLYVPLTAEEDASSYTCRASSPFIGQAINEVVTLSVRYTPIFFLREPQQVTVLENETVTLNGTAFGNPDFITYEWLKDGQPLRSSFSRSSQPKVVVSGALLVINEIDRAHAGHYSCKAHNAEGASVITFSIVVRHSADIVYISQPSMVNVGESITLECDATAFPLVDQMTNWNRSNYNMSRAIVGYSKGKATLHLRQVDIDDAGAFTCIAYNGIGTPSKKKTWVVVTHAPVIHKSTSYSKSASELGAQATLRCIAKGAPEVTWQWQRSNGEQLDYDVRFNTMTKQLSPIEYESKLVVKKVQKDDYANYRCIARNELGTDQFDIPLIHLSIPDPPTELVVTNVSQDSVTLRWRANFDGGLPQKYRVRYYAQDSPENILYGKSVNVTYAVVRGLLPLTKYSFSVESFNRLGTKGVSSASVQAETTPWTGSTASVSQQGVKEDIPVLVIVLVCLVGVVLLALNAVLVLCFIRRHRNRKLQVSEQKVLVQNNTESSPSAKTDSSFAEKAANVRLMEQTGIAQYSTVDKQKNGSLLNQENFDSTCTFRPTSQFSEDNISLKTVIEIDSTGRPVLVEPCSPSPCQPTYFSYQAADDYGQPPTDAMYAERLRSNDLQRQFASPIYQDCSFHAPSDDDFITPMMGPLRSISQEMGSYSGYNNYPTLGSSSSSLRRPVFDSASPSVSRPNYSVGTVVYSNGRSPFAEVRPLPSPAPTGHVGYSLSGHSASASGVKTDWQGTLCRKTLYTQPLFAPT